MSQPSPRFRWRLGLVCLGAAALLATGTAAQAPARPTIPRTADGKPNLQGIWQARTRAAYNLEDHAATHLAPAGRSVVDGGTIPYRDEARKQRDENYRNRAKLDPLNQCFLPGIPRLMLMEFPFHIFQTPTHIAMTFEWSQVFRLIYTNGSKHVQGIDFWMGDPRGRWEGDTLVIDVTNINDRTWFDAAGNFHSGELRVTERLTMLDPNTIRYQATMTDPKVFTKPWSIIVPLHRQDIDRVLEYQCQAEAEEANGLFPRDPLTWFPGR